VYVACKAADLKDRTLNQLDWSDIGLVNLETRNSDAMPNTYKLTYFNMTGRGETIRLIFAAAGVPFEDVRIDNAAWESIKPTTPWGGVPVLEVNGKAVIGQSMSVARFAARETGLDGKTSLEQALVDSVSESINELKEKLYTAFKTPDEANKAIAMNDYVANTLPNYLTNIDRFFGANNGGKGFLVGDKLTWADLHLMATFEAIRQLAPQATDKLAKFPHLEQLVVRVAATPKVAEYLKKRG